MAVGELRGQRSALTSYDEDLIKALRQQAANTTASMYANSPVGALTSNVLSTVLANRNEARLRNREDRAIDANAMYADYLRDGNIEGKTVDASGNIVEMTEQPMFREEQVQNMVPSGTNEVGTPSLGRAPEVSASQEQVRSLTADVLTPSSVGEEQRPGFFARLRGEENVDPYTNLNQIKKAGNIDPIAALQYEKELAKENAITYDVKTDTKGNVFYYDEKNPAGGTWITNPNKLKEGFKVLSKDEADLKNLPVLGAGAFYQIDTANDRVYKTGTDKGATVEVTNYMGAGDGAKYGTKAVVERHTKDQEKKYGVDGALSANRASYEVGNSLLQLIEGGVETGMFAPYKKFLYSVGEATGWLDKDDLSKLASMEGFQAEANQIVLKFIKNLGRNPTDLDLKFMIQTMPNLSKSELANKFIIQSRMIGSKYVMEALNWEKNYVMERNSALMDLPSSDKNYGKRVHTSPDEINKLDIARRDYTKEKQILMDEEFKKVRKLVETQKNEDEGIVEVSDEDIEIMEQDMNNNNNRPVVNPNPLVIKPNQPPPMLTQPYNQIMPPKPKQPFNYDMEINKLKVELNNATGDRINSIMNEITLLTNERNQQRMQNR